MKTILQTVCVIAVSSGIIVELIYGADIGFTLITGGGLAFAISTKIHGKGN